ncbi:hypothetical protein BN946_scf184977.g121 [Trametes cinnabarina]|uniref:RBR-type E3 ubiquitin transferase n=1 Tax=Pycnoporus cinnabarinus TaxID=5643 RepID=A0A060SDZ4_PYCCI|nr:hypothetical protein BN946_scf184977.g121 [Trametes cinnabarina]
MLHATLPPNALRPLPSSPPSPQLDVLDLLNGSVKSSPLPRLHGKLASRTNAAASTSPDTAAQRRAKDEELALSLFVEETAALHESERDDDYLDQLVLEEEMAMYDHEVALAIAEDREPPPRPAALDRGKRVQGGVFRREHHLVARFADGFETPVLHLEENTPQKFEEALRSALKQLSIEQTDDDDAPLELTGSVGNMRSRLNNIRKDLGYLADNEGASSIPFIPPSPFPSPPPPVYSCALCGDDIEGSVVHLDCGHAFDRTCIAEMFTKATVDESLFPPKCCRGAIELSAVQANLDPGLIRTFQKKAREFTTADRVYCHNPACATFLGPALDEDSLNATTLRCPECDAGTCASCKEQIHPGVPCHYPAEDIVLGLGKEKGWQRCPSCKHLVELSFGCYHIICRCNKQFCYLCAAPWKECGCDLFYVPPEEE